MKNQITILFAGGLLAANAVMAAPVTAQTGFTSYGGSTYIAINIDPQDAEAYKNRGLAKYKSGDKKGAIADYDNAIRINPQYAEAYGNRGIAKDDLGDKKGAIADYDSAIRINPQYADAYYNRGNAKSDLDDKQGAIADYDSAIRINPQYAKAYTNRADGATGRLKTRQGCDSRQIAGKKIGIDALLTQKTIKCY
jgi:tetratricopeptide (TPR) repeat protein